MPDIFTPLDLGSLRLTNRIFMAPMNRNRALPDGSTNPLAPIYYAQRASAGLIISGALHVSPLSVAAPDAPSLYTAAHAASWKPVTSAIHAAGGRIFAQIRHAGRLSPSARLPDRQPPLGPSAIAAKANPVRPDEPYDIPKAVSAAEIATIVDQFRAATVLAMEAGFDGIELHGGNGYLIDQFLRDGPNHRTDGYGGSIANRCRFLHEIIEAVSVVATPERVGVRLTPHAPHNDMHDSNPAATFVGIAAGLRGWGLAYLHSVEGVPGDVEAPAEGKPRIAGAMRSAFGGPMILTGGFDRLMGDRAVAEGNADAVGYGKPFLANPDLPERYRQGAALNTPDRTTFYDVSGDPARGYTDYAALPSQG